MSRLGSAQAALVGVLSVALASCATRSPAPSETPAPPVAAVPPAPSTPVPLPLLPADQVELTAVPPGLVEAGEGESFSATDHPQSAGIEEILAITTADLPPPTPETARAVAVDLEAIVHDIDIPLNARVLSFVELFTGRLKAFLEEGLSRGVRYLPMIQGIFRAEGLPLDLAYVPLVESAFKPTALSRARARGIWQFMRGTALENGLRHDWYIDERAEPEKATRAAAKYLKTLHEMFGGDWHLALASYNAGPGRVQRAVKLSGRSDFWTLAASSSYLPRETRDYVPLILAAMVIARNPVMYGFEIQPVEPPRFETVTLTTAIDLRRVAEWVGTPVRMIQDLNPELRRWTTPVHAAEYDLKVPHGAADIVQAYLTQTDPADLVPLNWHTVKKGETLLSIAKALKVTRTDLAEANYLSSRAKVLAGQRLIIPRAPALRAARSSPAGGEEPPETLVAVSTDAPARAAKRPAQVTYRVKRGDTLSSIARLYRTTVASLKAWNRLKSNSIQVGQRLTIFPTHRTTATS
jgi:membrane-bound lytic murein transglycosylase D